MRRFAIIGVSCLLAIAVAVGCGVEGLPFGTTPPHSPEHPSPQLVPTGGAPAPTGAEIRSAPPAAGRPFPRPPVERTVTVPAWIDSTGESDASAQLNEWLETVNDGTAVRFPRGGTYRLDTGITISARNDLTFDGRGTTLRLAGPLDSVESSGFYLNMENRNIVIEDFRIVGASPEPGVYIEDQEFQHGVAIRGGSNVEVMNVVVSGVGGDGIYAAAEARGVWLHDSRIESAGRMGVAVTYASDVIVERNELELVGYGAFDVEPNDPTQSATNIKFVNNVVGSISQDPPNGFFFAANGAPGSVVRDVTVDSNTITGDPLVTYVDWTPRQNIVFTNNVSTVPADGPVLSFAYVEGLVISGNVQPLQSGELARVVASTMQAD